MYTYWQSCVDFRTPLGITCLSKMIDDGFEITRKAFLKHVNNESLRMVEEGLGYSKHPSQGLTMAGDYHVTYYQGLFNGQRVYYFVQSAIEYIFTKEP